MKLVQFYDNERLRLGLIEAETITPIDFDGDMVSLIAGRGAVKKSGIPLSLENVKLAPPISRPSKIMAIGLNYKDHAAESKGTIPQVPLVFAKFPNSLIGPGDGISWDINITSKVDFEAEMAVVIGKKVHGCPKEEALKSVFGYTCANDVSARDLQFGDGQWVRGKSLDTFCPIGPWIITADEVPDPHSLKIRCWLNGHLMQDSSTGLLIFGVDTLIEFLSQHFTLFPGDVILTGTPSGVGAFRDPSVYLKDGDEIVVEIERIGRLMNTCRTFN